MIKKIKKILAVSLVTLAPAIAFCNAGPEGVVTCIEKTYQDGSTVNLRCPNGSRDCQLTITSFGTRQIVGFDFGKYGFQPLMGQLQLYADEKAPGDVSVVTDVMCRDGDLDAATSDAKDVICLLEISVNDGKVQSEPALHILPVSNVDIYRRLQRAPN
jgi:hypothetical protein